MANPTDVDRVGIASEDSFPASDPPAWGSSHAAPSESTVTADLDSPSNRMKYVKWAAIGVLAAGAIAGIGFAIYRYRR